MLDCMCHFYVHSYSLLKSPCNVSAPQLDLISRPILLLSANLLLSLLVPESRLSVQMMNNNGPNTDTCRTPIVTQPQSDFSSLTCTLFRTTKPCPNPVLNNTHYSTNQYFTYEPLIRYPVKCFVYLISLNIQGDEKRGFVEFLDINQFRMRGANFVFMLSQYAIVII